MNDEPIIYTDATVRINGVDIGATNVTVRYTLDTRALDRQFKEYEARLVAALNPQDEADARRILSPQTIVRKALGEFE